MRQSIRRGLILISLLLFPLTLNYFSPYVSIDGAMLGVMSGSLLLFIFMFATAIFFGRAWCAWVCPMAGLSEMALGINGKKPNVKTLKIIRYSIFAVWAGILVTMFILAGGIKGIDPFHLTENIISVDSGIKYIVYYTVLAIFIVLTFTLGKRGACHSICWMSPFLVAGFTLGRILKIPQLRIAADSTRCVNCGVCDKKCPMSIPVSSSAKEGCIRTSDCILCGECIDGCRKKVLSYSVKR
jgi:ferredoxin-type protein NapH